MMRNRLLALLLSGLLLAACGTVANPRPTFAPTNTALPRAANITDEDNADETELVQQDNAAEVAQAEATPAPTLPPTAEPTEEATPEPTEEPAAEPTEEATEEAAEEEAPAEEEAEVAEAGPGPIVVNGTEYEGDPVFGEVTFLQVAQVNYNNVDWNCAQCHNVAEPIPGSGPYLHGIANRLAERVAADDTSNTPSEYLVNSILHTNDYISPPQVGPDGAQFAWEANVMPSNWDSVLGDQEVADIVSYLLTLDQE